MIHASDSIRNIAIVGHGGVGKTTLIEHLLYAAKSIETPEMVETGRTVSDYTSEEIAHSISIHTSLSRAEWGNTKINLLDTPGASDFVGEVVTAFRVAESAVMVLNARAGVQIETIKLWRRLNTRTMPRLIFVTRLDETPDAFQSVVDNLRDRFDNPFTPLTLPLVEEGQLRGVIDVLKMKAYLHKSDTETETNIPDSHMDVARQARTQLMESAAEGSDELLEIFLENETLTDEQIDEGLRMAWQNGAFVPVLCGAGRSGCGTHSLLNLIASSAPNPLDAREQITDSDDNEDTFQINTDAPFSALCFKTWNDQYSGKISYIKVMTGTLGTDTDFINVREQTKERIGKLFVVNGKKLEPISQLNAGDIGALTKSASIRTNDSLCAAERIFNFVPLRLPHPIYSVVIETPDRTQEDKLTGAMHRMLEEDLTLTMTYNRETRESVLAGMGEFHLNAVLDKLRAQYKITITTRVPQVAYRETISKPTDSTYRHKKQSGGHGQFGEVSIKIRPLQHEAHYQFENLIRGMSVSKGYIPGIEKGLHEAMDEGVIAGFPIVDIGIQLVDGKEHSVDSSEMAFKLAAKGAMQQAIAAANPGLLEPIMNLEIIIEDQYLGDVLSDLNSKRGRVLGQDTLGGGLTSIKAQAPQASLLRYAIDLRSITSGTGSFEVEFSHYSAITGRIAEEVIKAATQRAEE